MKKTHIRTIIISVLVLLAAIITIFNINIEPVDKSQSSVVSSNASEAEKPKAEPLEKENTSEKQKTEKEPPSEKQKAQAEKETYSKEQAVEKNIPADEKQRDMQTVPFDAKTEKPAQSKPEQYFCTIEIRCDAVVDTSKLENQAAAPYVPKNGVVLEASEIEFTPGESVFDILLRAAKERNIHMEFRDDNLYSGKYIEGINYLYEMDGGPLSGWMYKVNGKFPNYGCAAYKVKDGDIIVWMYTCDLGQDVGDNSTW